MRYCRGQTPAAATLASSIANSEVRSLLPSFRHKGRFYYQRWLLDRLELPAAVAVKPWMQGAAP